MKLYKWHWKICNDWYDAWAVKQFNNIKTTLFAGHRSGGRDDLLSAFSKKGIQRHHETDFPKPLRSFMWTKENPSHTRLKETKVRALELERRIRGFLHSDGEKINAVQVELNRQRTLTATKERNFDSHRKQFSNWSNLSNHLFKERTHGDSLDTTLFLRNTMLRCDLRHGKESVQKMLRM